MPLESFPDENVFARYTVVNRNFSEIVRQPLYDFQLLAAAGAQSLSFFQLAQGAGVTSALGATVGATKSVADTNMQVGGFLPSGMQFLAEALEVQFFPGSVSTANTYTPATMLSFATAAAATVGAPWINDVNTFYQSGVLLFNVLAKDYLTDTPLLKFVPRVQFSVSGAIATNSATVGEAIIGQQRPDGPPYWLEEPITLEPAANFSVKLQWPAAVAMPSGFNGRVGVALHGFMKRAGQ